MSGKSLFAHAFSKRLYIRSNRRSQSPRSIVHDDMVHSDNIIVSDFPLPSTFDDVMADCPQ